MTELSTIAEQIAQDVEASPGEVEAELHRYHNEFRVSLEQSKIQVRKDFGSSPDRKEERTEEDESEPTDPFVGHYDETISEVQHASDTLNLTNRCEEKAMTIADLLLKEVSEETHPAPVASGIVYTAGLLTDDKRTQAEVADALDTSEQSVKYHYPTAIRLSNFR